MSLDLPRNGSRTAEPELLRKSDHPAPEIGSNSLGSCRVAWPNSTQWGVASQRGEQGAHPDRWSNEHSNVGTVGLPSALYPYEPAFSPTRNTGLDHPASNRTERVLSAWAPLAQDWPHGRWTNA